MPLDLDDFNSVKTLRFLAGYSQKRAAELAGVTIRTWRRWEAGEAPLVAIRWLRYECGIVPGWPRGWRVSRYGVQVPGIRRDVTFGMIEGSGWAYSVLLERADEDLKHVRERREAREAEAEADAGRRPGANVIPMHGAGEPAKDSENVSTAKDRKHG